MDGDPMTDLLSNNSDSFLFGYIIIFFLFLFIILGVIVFQIVKGIHQWHKNNQSEIITSFVFVRDKRNHAHHHVNQNTSHTSHTHFITFEFDNKERQEFRIKPDLFGLISIGDVGYLTFKGTRFIEFERVQ